MRGWIYVITNKAMPGIVKIGYSMKDPRLRADELNHTGSPYPYEVEYEVLIEEPSQFERNVHLRLKDYSVGKEWFNCALDDAVRAIRNLGGKSIIYENSENLRKNNMSQRDNESHGNNETNRTISSPKVNYESGYKPETSTHVVNGKKILHIKQECTRCKKVYSFALTNYRQNSHCPSCGKYHSTDADPGYWDTSSG